MSATTGRALGVLLLVLVAVNAAVLLSPLFAGSSQLVTPDSQANAPAVADEGAALAETIEAAGSPTRVTGILNYVITGLMIVAAVGLLMLRGWGATTGAVLLALDAIVRVINVVAEVVVGRQVAGLVLSIVLAIVSGVLAVVYWRARPRANTPLTTAGR